MTIETEGAAASANDTNVTDATQTNAAQNSGQDAGTDTSSNDDSSEELDADGNPVEREPQWAEIEIDGKKYKVEAAAKDGYLRQSDYTKKTMEVADQRKALEADREGFKAATEAQKAHFQVATKLAGLDDQLGAYKNVDWQALYASNPDQYQQHRINYDALKDQRDAVARDYSQKEQDRIQNEARESDTRVQKVQAEITRLIPEWAPGNELDTKLSTYGTSIGLSQKDMGEMVLRNPVFARELNRLRLYDEAAKKQQTQQTFQVSQEAKPVTRVGGNSGAATARTTDASGDKLSTAEWMRREKERVAKRGGR